MMWTIKTINLFLFFLYCTRQANDPIRPEINKKRNSNSKNPMAVLCWAKILFLYF